MVTTIPAYTCAWDLLAPFFILVDMSTYVTLEVTCILILLQVKKKQVSTLSWHITSQRITVVCVCVCVCVCALPCLHSCINIYQCFNTREIAQFSHVHMCLFLANHPRMDIRRLSLENTYKLFIQLQIGEYICTSIHTSIYIYPYPHVY